MFRLITRTLVIAAVCLAVFVVLMHAARASGTGYSAEPATNAQPPATTQASPQGADTVPITANATGNTSIAATPLPGDVAEPQEQAEPQGQTEPQEQVEPQEQELSGIVASSDSTHSAFTLRTSAGAITVFVTRQTKYSDGLNTLADVHAGMNLSVEGIRQTGRFVASDVQAQNATSDPSEPSNSTSASDGN